MLQGQLKKWLVDKNAVTLTVELQNTKSNRDALANLYDQAIVTIEVAQGELGLYEEGTE